MLKLPQRPAKLGNAINTRAEKHGEGDVTAHECRLPSTHLQDFELNVVLREPLAHGLLFDVASSPPEPALKNIRALTLADKIESASVTLYVGLDLTPVRLSDCKLKSVRL